jgi:hypothetical protein
MRISSVRCRSAARESVGASNIRSSPPSSPCTQAALGDSRTISISGPRKSRPVELRTA